MRFEYLIGARYLRARRRERFVSLIAIISLVGVMIGSFTLTVALAVMSGLQEDLRERLLSFTPHITIGREGASLAEFQTLAEKLKSIPTVAGVAPFVSSQVMAAASGRDGTPGYVTGGVVRGVVARDNPVLTELARNLTAGTLEALGTRRQVTISDHGQKRQVELANVIVGKALALDLGLRLGDPMTLISPTSFGAVSSVPRLKRFVIGGYFESGMAQYDDSLIFVGLDEAAKLLGDDRAIERGLEVRVTDLFEAPRIARQIAQIAGAGYQVKDWTETDASLFSALKLEKFTYFAFLLLIVLVAAFNIIATLVMVVMERRKEIAILQAMGARAHSIAAIFLFQGAVLGLAGTVSGVGAGFLTSFLIGKYHLIRLPSEAFMISSLPVRLYPINFIAVAVAAIAVCIAASLYPALQARSLSPVEVIRYE